MYDPTRDRFLDKYRDSGDNMITGLISDESLKIKTKLPIFG